MIDTDKYEGHTPSPWLWYVDDGDVDLVVADDQCRTVIEEVKALNTKADAELIADAPLILNELKRYKEVVNRVLECALNDNAEQAMQFLLNMDYCLDDEEKVTDKNRHKYTWVNGEWRNKE